jgi:MFS transporter, BCD family, chlorophyll transporter
MMPPHLGWVGIMRLGLVQTALGSIVVLTTSTLNRVMVVELALPAVLPGLLVGLHYALQILRPRWGYGSDMGGRSTAWIIGGMFVLALGGFAAATATALMTHAFWAGLSLAILAFGLIGIGVGTAGTTLLVLLAKRVDPGKRAAAATIVWVMMIVGFIVTTALAGHFLDPFSPSRLVAVSAAVSVLAVLLTLLAMWNLEGQPTPTQRVSPGLLAEAEGGFRKALLQIWAEPQSRSFAIFVFVSMLAYSSQDLILEPFAGAVFDMTPGQSTKLSSVQHGGVLLGMVTVALLASGIGGPRLGSLRGWVIGGCIASATTLALLAMASAVGPAWPLRATVFGLGVANGVYAVAAIGSMMGLAAVGRASREGVRMGLWGAAQAVAFGLGGFLGTLASDVARHLLGSPTTAYAAVFSVEAALFLVSAALAARVSQRPAPAGPQESGQAPLAATGSA